MGDLVSSEDRHQTDVGGAYGFPRPHCDPVLVAGSRAHLDPSRDGRRAERITGWPPSESPPIARDGTPYSTGRDDPTTATGPRLATGQAPRSVAGRQDADRPRATRLPLVAGRLTLADRHPHGHKGESRGAGPVGVLASC